MQHADPHVLARAQRQFTLQHALQNLLPSLQYRLAGKPLFPSDKITLCTSSIFPPLTTLWHHVVRKCLGNLADIFILDCAGTLDPADVPGATVQRFLNVRHATKIDLWLSKTLRNRRFAWICDDDVFPVNAGVMNIIRREFAKPRTATVSLRPRTWWHFEIDGKRYEPSGSYCLSIDRKIFEREKLSAQPADGNTHPTHTGKVWTRYDTLDKANEELIKRGYHCAIVPEQDRNACIVGFNGTSIAALLLNHFRSADELLTYLNAATPHQWSASVLPRCLAALLAADVVRDLFCAVTGQPWQYPNLPAKTNLMEVRKKAEPHLSPAHNLGEIDATAQRLHSILSPIHDAHVG